MTLLNNRGWNAIHLIDSPGLPHQRNTGLDYVSSNFKYCQFVSFLDDDIFIETDYFERVQSVFDLDPQIVVVGGFDIDASQQAVKKNFVLSAMGILPRSDGRIAKSGLARVPRPFSIADDVDFVPGGMQSLRLGLLGETKFDESSSFFGEDIEMHFKLSTKGRVVSSNALPVRHLNATEGKQDNGEGLLNEQLVRLRLHLENPGRVTYLHLILGCLVVFAWEIVRELRGGNFRRLVSVSDQFAKALKISLSRKMAPSSN
jgi:glycosyltransferase involved in cell wall biosynthesis